MQHWFDIFTRSMAGQPHRQEQALTRRTMLSWAAKLGVAASGVALFGRTGEVAQAAPPGGVTAAAPSIAARAAQQAATVIGTQAAPAAASCSVDDSYGVLTSLVSTTAPGSGSTSSLTLTHSFIAEVGSGVVQSTLTVSPGSNPKENAVLRLSSTALADRSASAHTVFGPLYTGAGVKRSSFSTDGRTLQGSIEGRAIRPVSLGTDPKSITFQDGQAIESEKSAPANPTASPAPFGTRATPPERSVPATGSAQQREVAGIQAAVSALLLQSRGQLGTCQANPQAPKATVRCTQCQLDCRGTWLQCSVTALNASLPSGAVAAGAYLTAANATCDAGLQTCLQTCKSSGNCCPEFCKGDAACCRTAWGCCPPSASSTQQWSRSWPTCPRCGPPPWQYARTITPPRRIS